MYSAKALLSLPKGCVMRLSYFFITCTMIFSLYFLYDSTSYDLLQLLLDLLDFERSLRGPGFGLIYPTDSSY
jgi:hypothetical protein